MNGSLSGVLEGLATHYSATVHGPLVLSLCVFGICANIVNILVLTRPKMRESPTNFLLCGLSAAQLFLLLNFFAYSVYSSSLARDECSLGFKSYPWLVYLVLTVNLNVVLHSTALAHTTLLAFFRFLAVHFPSHHFVTLQRAKVAVYATFILCPIFFISFYVNSKIELIPQDEITMCLGFTADTRAYFLTFRYGILTNFNFLAIAIVGKIAPSVALAVLSFLLAKDMKRAEKRRELMLGRACGESHSQRLQTTIMLLVIVLTLVAVELPQGILNMLSALLGKDFRQHIYIPLGDFFEMLTIFYSSINFILYCTMSSQFRSTFARTFACLDLRRLLNRHEATAPPTPTETMALMDRSAL